jgi:hypothetical protein
MEIEEIASKHPIKIRSFKFSCDCKDKDIPDPLPNTYNHCLMITAKPKQGKTTLIYNLLTKQKGASPYYQKFDKIFIFSPSMKTIDNDPFENLDDNQKFATMSYENLELVHNEIQDCGQRILIIADDVVMDIAKDKDVSKLLTKMMMNRRHICGRSEEEGEGAGLSMWITSQVFNKLPRPLRATASHHVIFKTSNKKELATIFDELILLDKVDFEKLLRFVFNNKFNFLYINTDEEFDSQYHRNFNRLRLKNINIM